MEFEDITRSSDPVSPANVIDRRVRHRRGNIYCARPMCAQRTRRITAEGVGDGKAGVWGTEKTGAA
jgi:hypothetical protein